MSEALVKGLAEAATVGMAAAAARGDTATSVVAVAADKPVIVQKVEEAIKASPEYQHITSTEPWYQSRANWSAIIAAATVILAPAFKLAGHELVLDAATADALATAAAAIGGLASALLARRARTATKPLGA